MAGGRVPQWWRACHTRPDRRSTEAATLIRVAASVSCGCVPAGVAQRATAALMDRDSDANAGGPTGFTNPERIAQRKYQVPGRIEIYRDEDDLAVARIRENPEGLKGMMDALDKLPAIFAAAFEESPPFEGLR